jgi:hypothetical protein
MATIQFFERYPMMAPYVGKDFHHASSPAILMIGESFYLNEDTAHRRSPEAWYSGSSANLTDYEITYIHNHNLIVNSRAGNFKVRAHSIFKNPFLEINRCGPVYADYKRVADHIAFHNFFLRPAVDGDSLVNELSSMDLQLANEVFLAVCEQLKPTVLVFVSVLAFNCCKVKPAIPMIVTPHPGCRWWNQKAAKYGNRNGREVLGDFIKTLDWIQTTM